MVVSCAPLFSVSLPVVKVEFPDVCHDRVPVLLKTELGAPFRLIEPLIVPALLIVIAPDVEAFPGTRSTRSELRLPVDWMTPPTLLFSVKSPAVELITTDGLLPAELL